MAEKQIKAVVTGAASGLGKAVAEAVAKDGGQVAIFDISPKGPSVAEGIGSAASFMEVNVADESAVSSGLEKAAEAMGGINACVNCAGIANGIKTFGRDGPFPLPDFKKVIDVNLIGSFNLMRLASAEMAKNEPGPDGERGAIVNTASVAAFEGQKGQAAYSASKAGIAGLSLPVARDLASIGVRVNAIAPGLFITPIWESLDESVMNSLAQDVVFPKRLGHPEEFADLVMFMLRNSYMNGATVRIDGGIRLP